MKIDGHLGKNFEQAGDTARRLESLGYDGAWSAEAGTDPFLPLAVAATATSRLQIGTNIAVAFARNPMTVATVANDLQRSSQGRFVLGLGSQIRAHIEKRFSMPWSHPAPRMREFVLAMRAIWAAWNDGSTLDFHGDYYTHTLMTPFFAPEPHAFGPPKVYLAAVGTKMVEVAGEVCDGLLVHPFTTERYLREVTVPTLEPQLAHSGRTRADFELSYAAIVVTGRTDEEREKADRDARRQIAFYGSTPAYRPVLELHGWGDLQGELNRLSKQGDWRTMRTLIDDDILDAFAIVAAPDDVPDRLAKRFGGVVDRMSLYFEPETDRLEQVLQTLRAAGS